MEWPFLAVVGIIYLAAQNRTIYVLSFPISYKALIVRPSPYSSLLQRRAALSPSWEALEAQIKEAAHRQTQPTSIDSALDDTPLPESLRDSVVLFRERHGWCPYSQRVWMALELDCVDGTPVAYDTVRIDNTGGPRPSYFSGQTPQVRWPGQSRTQSESMDLIKEVDRRYHGGALNSDDVHVQHAVSQFRTIFPSARPSSRAAFLFQYSGEPLWRRTFEETLKMTDDLLRENNSPNGEVYFSLSQLTAADLAWAPFLERYRYQLPCLHDGLRPYDANKYPYLTRWYDTMLQQFPAYACRITGNASSWRKVLVMAGFGNAGVPPTIARNMEMLISNNQEHKQAEACINLDTWQLYTRLRPFVASTPYAEAAAIILRNRHAILRDLLVQAQKPKWESFNLPCSEAEANSALCDMVSALLESGGIVGIRRHCQLQSGGICRGVLLGRADVRSEGYGRHERSGY